VFERVCLYSWYIVGWLVGEELDRRR